ncbi:hypothetical protein LPB136_07115 [Tenacibaculum todarodis]|uniref:ADP-ribosylglycohydrolase n=1 Tax=Tenacibaculum todarodis TaxID=1850252 RepID=A0A1L3JJ65_9FLAO|nr:ADP-ribosylglycohydrolase family protein [Tenacibaculum todarodis]APG65133.1 hypothetical protein LPB136_07115 [Tenacibaculum todarodis]
MKKKKLSNGIMGLILADALGVPVEFQTREQLKENPVVDMREYGTYLQPKGTWSDDSSLTLCTLKSLQKGFSLKDIAKNFIAWKFEAAFTPHGEVFDIGFTTSKAIAKLVTIIEAKNYKELELLKLETDEKTNGNGSLMRILPLYYEVKKKGVEQEFEKIWNVSALTHGHIRSAISCLVYLVLIDELIKGKEKQTAYKNTQNRVKVFFKENEISVYEQEKFDSLIKSDISKLDENQVKSTGYVIDSLEASIWCFLTTNSYKEAVLKAVNLGEDTDTIGAITGGLAGVFYGKDSLPKDWWQDVVNYKYVEKLSIKLERGFISWWKI